MTLDSKPDIGRAMSELVQTALAEDKLSGLSVMLGVIAKTVNAQIAILWQVAPEPVENEIFILAEWFQIPPKRTPLLSCYAT